MKPSPDDELVFLPLGGSNEIGMNFNCYGYGPPDDRKWIIVDVGVTFGDQTTPGVEIIMPDPTYIEELADDKLIQTAAEIMANEGQHATVLRELTSPGNVSRAVPTAFVGGSA